MTPSLAGELAAAAISAHVAVLDPKVSHEARRTLLNVLATSIGASRNPMVDSIFTAARFGGTRCVPAIGRATHLDPYFAALAIGAAAHVDDFDDTHLQTVIHPGASGLGAAWAAAHLYQASGRQFLSAFALGCEAQLRLGVAVSPEHYDNGWHITGTCGAVGGAVTAGLLADHDEKELTSAIAIAANSTLGHREAFGTHAKAFHAGKAAAAGVLAVALARGRAFRADGALEPPSGLIGVLAHDNDASHMTTGFGDRWELLKNTYKPYPCGIVAHPGIDAAIELHARAAHRNVERIFYHCHPLVPELMGNVQPSDGLEARFSAVHGVAVGLVTGRAGLAEFDTGYVRDSDVIVLREVVEILTHTEFARDEALVEVVTRDGATASSHVEHARGSLARPLTDAELTAKAATLIEPILGSVSAVIEAVESIEALESIGDLAAAVAVRNDARP